MSLKKNFSVKLKQIPIAIIGLYASSAFALEPFLVKDIRVEGLQRTEAGTVFSYLPVKVGETMDDEKLRKPSKRSMVPVSSRTFVSRLMMTFLLSPFKSAQQSLKLHSQATNPSQQIK